MTTPKHSLPAAEAQSLALQNLPYWTDLTNEQKEFISRRAVLRHFDKGTHIDPLADGCLGPVIVVKGTLRVFIPSAEGREISLYYLRQGDTCVLSSSCLIGGEELAIQLGAEETLDLIIIPADVMNQLTEDNAHVQQQVFRLSAERYTKAMTGMSKIVFQSFDSRLADFLLEESERLGSKEIKMTQEEIARAVSTAREVVARSLKRFSEEGLVLLGRGTVTLTDPSALAFKIED